MSVTIKNENYGYSVATYGDYVAIGSPPSFRKNQGFSIGMVNVKKYDSSVDQYVPYLELQKTLNLQQLDVALSDTNFSDLLTENGESLDSDLNETDIVKLENEYGNSLSIYGTELAVGTTLNLRATTVNTLFGTNSQLQATLTVVGRDSGARVTIPVTVTKVS